MRIVTNGKSIWVGSARMGVGLALSLVPLLGWIAVASDPGVRGGAPAAGDMMTGLSSDERRIFLEGLDAFNEISSVQGETYVPNTEAGLGPRFNLDSCAGCHSHPAVGGTSPAINPQVAAMTRAGATNMQPPFITLDGPVREARFKRKPDGKRDGSAQGLFTISGRVDAPGCSMAQPDFAAATASNNVALRIPTPLFGAGLIEAIPDAAILANKSSSAAAKLALGISGHENRNDNDGTVSRFGWKAQNKSLEIFAGEAYLVEMGVTNHLFPDERGTPPDACLFNPTAESSSSLQGGDPRKVLSDNVRFAFFMRFLAPPTPAPDTPSVANGRSLFNAVGCGYCHTPSLPTGKVVHSALRYKQANLYSDLLVHRMGTGLADDIVQGDAGPDEFRTAPLWGLGQRIFLLHDGRTKNLIEAIQMHASAGSEASGVIANYNNLSPSQQQDLLNFLRSL